MVKAHVALQYVHRGEHTAYSYKKTMAVNQQQIRGGFEHD
jgi:hypothetical protein